MKKIGKIARKTFRDKIFVGISVMSLAVVLVVIITEHISCFPAYIVAISAISLISMIAYFHAIY